MKKRGGWKKADLPCVFKDSVIALPTEEWRSVVGWERHYRVSSLGRLYSLHQTGRFVIGMLVRGGYRVMKLRSEGRSANAMVHRLVLEAFVGPAPLGHEACHGISGVSDNSLGNLRWDTKLANHADRIEHGTSLRGKLIPRKLTAALVRTIRLADATDEWWARRLHVTSTTIFHARTGKTWRHVDTAPQWRR